MTTEEKINHLITIAQEKMRHSHDPIHDITHAERVAGFAERLAEDYSLPLVEKQALVLTAWWHDVGRTVTKKPSFIYMIFFDDVLSSILLWRATRRLGLSGTVTSTATRLIFCHSYGTGKLFRRILLGERGRLLLDIMMDADKLDILCAVRMQRLFDLARSARRYHVGYKMLGWYNFTRQRFRLKTVAAEKYFEQVFRGFLEWLYNPVTKQSHIDQFGIIWSEKMHKRIKKLIVEIDKTELMKLVKH